MTEEEAVFVMGKALSELRNSGEDLSTKRVRVGKSWVLPDELADAYDKHFPPGPRRHKQLTDKIFTYEMVNDWDCRGEPVGLRISHLGRSIDVLEKAEVFRCNNRAYKEKIKTSLCNRYDVIDGDWDAFIIDKVDETISMMRTRFRIDGVTFCEETLIAGNGRVYVEGMQPYGVGCIGRSYFPFVKFDKFWTVWNGYVEFRKRQIAELRNIG
jgi:hypothetical protein